MKYVCNSLGNWERLGDPNAECSSPCDVGMVPFRGGCYGVSTATASFDEALQASRALVILFCHHFTIKQIYNYIFFFVRQALGE